MILTATDADGSPLDDSRLAQWLRLPKLLLAVPTLAVSLWKAASGPA